MQLVHAINDVFLSRPVAARRPAVSEAARTEKTQEDQSATYQGVFVDPKALASFPIAAGVVATISKIILAARPGANMLWVALAVSIAIGGLMIVITTADKPSRPQGAVRWVITIAVGLINSLLLCAAVIGVSQLTGFPANR